MATVALDDILISEIDQDTNVVRWLRGCTISDIETVIPEALLPTIWDIEGVPAKGEESFYIEGAFCTGFRVRGFTTDGVQGAFVYERPPGMGLEHNFAEFYFKRYPGIKQVQTEIDATGHVIYAEYKVNNVDALKSTVYPSVTKIKPNDRLVATAWFKSEDDEAPDVPIEIADARMKVNDAFWQEESRRCWLLVTVEKTPIFMGRVVRVDATFLFDIESWDIPVFWKDPKQRLNGAAVTAADWTTLRGTFPEGQNHVNGASSVQVYEEADMDTAFPAAVLPPPPPPEEPEEEEEEP